VEKLELIINGEKVKLPENVGNVSELIQHFGLDHKVVMIELNQEILEKSKHSETILSNGDRVEMVHFVGGG